MYSPDELEPLMMKIYNVVRTETTTGNISDAASDVDMPHEAVVEINQNHSMTPSPSSDSIYCNVPITITANSSGDPPPALPSTSIARSVTSHPNDQILDYAAPVAKRGRMFGQRHQTRRLVQKTGECNVFNKNVTKRHRQYIVDLFTTLIEMRWRYHVVMFTAFFVVSWVAFGTIYWIVAYVCGDIGRVPHDETICMQNVFDYPSAVLYAFETQTTIGYGVRAMNPNCSVGIFLLMLQLCIGTFIQALATGLIFAKISRPKGRSQTLMFSHVAVVCKRDGQYQLIFRVGDMRTKSHIIGTSIRALMVRNRLTDEGELIPLCQFPLALETETGCNDSFVFLVWPVSVVHRIDSSSPMWDMSAEDFLIEHFEIIVILEGTVEATGSSTQVRTSYLPYEIRWGQRLAPLVTFQKDNGCYAIDYSQFNNTSPIAMPDCSAKDWSEQGSDADGEDASDFPVSFTTSAIRMTGATVRQNNKHTFFAHKFLTRRQSKKQEMRAKSKSNGSRAKLISTTPPVAGSGVQSGLWTVADPLRPAATGTRRGSLPQLMVHRPSTDAASTDIEDKTDSGIFGMSSMSTPIWRVTTNNNYKPAADKMTTRFQLEKVSESVNSSADDVVTYGASVV